MAMANSSNHFLEPDIALVLVVHKLNCFLLRLCSCVHTGNTCSKPFPVTRVSTGPSGLDLGQCQATSRMAIEMCGLIG